MMQVLSSSSRWLALSALLVTASCSTPTSTTNLWQAQVPARAPMTRIIVFGPGTSEASRRIMEDGFVTALKVRGVEATPSYSIFPTIPNEARARPAIQAAGFDGVLTSIVREIKDTPAWVPVGNYYLWGGGYYNSPSWTGQEGYIINRRAVGVETMLWDLRDEGGRATLVWTATTRTDNPSDTADTVNSMTKELVPKLSSAGLIK